LHALVKHPLLDCDLEAAALWYSPKNLAVAERLIDETRRAMQLVARHPFHFSKRFGEIRRIRLTGFPHSLYFYVRSETVVALALIHGSQNIEDILRKRMELGS
jgi:plasmid stabilization system protein ParE